MVPTCRGPVQNPFPPKKSRKEAPDNDVLMVIFALMFLLIIVTLSGISSCIFRR